MSLASLLALFLAVPQDSWDDWAYSLPKPKPRFKHTVPFRTATVSGDGTILVGLDAEGVIHGWDTRTAKLLYRRAVLAGQEGPQDLRCSVDGRYVALSSRDPAPSLVRVLRLATGEEVRRIDRCFSPAFSPDGEFVVGTDGRKLRRWALKSGAELPSLEESGQEFKWAAYSPKGDLVAASSGTSSAVVVWDVVTRRQLLNEGAPDNLWVATSLAFSPDGKSLAVGNHWGIRFLNLTKEPRRSPEVHEEYAIGPLKYSGDGRRMIALSRHRRLLIWDLDSGRHLFTWSAFNTPDGILEISEGGDRAIWVDRGGLRVERIPLILGGEEKGHVVKSVSFTAEGYVLTGDDKGTVRVWDPVTQKEVKHFAVPPRPLKFFARSGQWGIFGGGADPVQIWDLSAKREIANVPAAPDVNAVAVSPDGAAMALGHSDGSLSLWSVAEKREKTRIRLDLAGVSAVRWSGDGKSLAWGDQLGAVVIAEGSAGRDPIRFKSRGDAAIRELLFSPDGRSVVAGNARGVCLSYEELGREPVRVERMGSLASWEPVPGERWIASGFKQKGTLGIASVALSPDGAYAVTMTTWGTALIWEAPGDK